jgi:long-chain acyl-CoA synthetase
MTGDQVQNKCYIHGKATATRGRIRRNLRTKDGPLLSAEQSDRKTIWENWSQSLKTHADNRCLGERYLENGQLTGYKYKTYREVNNDVEQFRSGLRHLGVGPGQHVAVYSKNRTEWQVTDLAAQSIGCVTIPLYDTLGPDAARYVLENAECVACVVDMQGLQNVINIQNDFLKLIVLLPPRTFDPKETLQEYKQLLKVPADSALNVVAYDDVLKIGAANPNPAVPPSGSNMATICYTSGTTGVPKGVTLTHTNMMSDVLAIQTDTVTYPTDCSISYLPLAHMYERCMEISMMMSGGRIGYYRGDTTLLLEDIGQCHPTIFCGVPRLFNRIYDKIMSQINESNCVKRNMFNFAYNWKKQNLESDGSLTSNLDFVFAKIRNAFGGQVRMMVTGSAPISPVIMEFLRICASTVVIEGYGQTETAAAVSSTLEEDQVGAGFVGVPLPCSEIALFDVPGMNYTQADVIEGKRVERGEICFRGPNMTAGYWKMPEKTAEMIDAEGWLHSGDIGMWTENGYLKIIDRKKNIFKLSQGEYVAPEKVENVYAVSAFIAQAFVYGDSLKPSLVAIIVPDEEIVIPWLKKNGVAVSSLTEACKEPLLKKAIEDDMRKLAKDRGLHGFEQAKAIHLFDDLFTLENGLLTPTFKLKRPIAKKQFLDVIEHLYTTIPVSKSRL